MAPFVAILSILGILSTKCVLNTTEDSKVLSSICSGKRLLDLVQHIPETLANNFIPSRGDSLMKEDQQRCIQWVL